jgi:hypothetical protein
MNVVITREGRNLVTTLGERVERFLVPEGYTALITVESDGVPLDDEGGAPFDVVADETFETYAEIAFVGVASPPVVRRGGSL